MDHGFLQSLLIQQQGRAEWPVTTTRRAWRKRETRESKVVYHHNPGYSTRRIPSPPVYASSPEDSTPRNNGQLRFQPPPEQTASLEYLHYFNMPAGNTNFNHPIIHQQQIPVDGSWLSTISSYTLAPNPPNSPRYNNSAFQSPQRGHQQMMSNGGQEVSFEGPNPGNGSLSSDIENIHMSDLDFGSFDSFDSMGGMSTPNTAPSSLDETYVFPVVTSGFGPSEATGLALPDDFYKFGQTLDPSPSGDPSPTSPLDFPFEGDYIPISTDWNFGMYGTDSAQWSATTLIATQQDQGLQNGMGILSQPPWNSESAHTSDFQQHANSGVIAFEPSPGTPYRTHIDRQEFLNTGQANKRFFGPEPATSPAAESDGGSWVVPSYPNSNYAASHNSPCSHGSPASHAPSPLHQDAEHHEHIFSSIPGVPKPKLPRGRQRGLTALEKKQARDVREAKACWACHISKTKCSPCSPGKPCEQCARLAGKRRFCLFSCFNDPLESLSTFLVPDYLMGHFTKANVESFVTRNASSWGTQFMVVRMTWGYRKLLQAEVVALALRSNSSEMGYQHQTLSNGNARPLLVRKQSPPLGIPLAAMDDMLGLYSSYIQDIVQSDLAAYVPVAYTDQDSKLPERLLGAVCSFYNAGLETDNECDLLRRAIEMHVTAVILERSLILDSDSLDKVQDHLGQEYPARSAPRCAQRQIKLAFFILQQKRIMRVLKDWGAMMWATNNNTSKDHEWATAFSVFLILILVMDKTLGAAYYFCEGRIAHHGYEAGPQRAEFQNLVRLTQKELFDRCKEIFHWKFKTRKAGKEACNPIRDGIDAFQGKSRSGDSSIASLVWNLRAVAEDFDQEVRLHRSSNRDSVSEYTDAGRLACIFLDDFLSR